MGNECCQEGKETSILYNEPLVQKDYVDSVWPEEDQYIQKFLQTHPDKQGKKPLQNKRINQYYGGDWDETGPIGQGILYQPKNFLYRGNFVKGQPQGQGVVQLISKDCRYTGGIKDGNANGQGTFQNFQSKYTFTGSWGNSMPKSGEIRFEDGTIIQINDYQSKKAKIIYPDQKTYDGDIDLRDFTPNGKGTVVFPNGSSYIGDWKDGKMHGNGAFTWKIQKNGEELMEKYDGDYVDGKKQGQGTFIFSSGNYYEGAWDNGKMEGQGKMTDKNGHMLKEGRWLRGVYDNQKTVIYNNSFIAVDMHENHHSNHVGYPVEINHEPHFYQPPKNSTAPSNSMVLKVEEDLLEKESEKKQDDNAQ